MGKNAMLALNKTIVEADIDTRLEMLFKGKEVSQNRTRCSLIALTHVPFCALKRPAA